MRKSVDPGINPNFKFHKFKHEEEIIINNISREWYVTNAGSEIHLTPTSTYRFFVVKPCNLYQEMFNLEREIIIVFSPYERFEPRTLDAFDQAARTFQPLRIDKICSVVISKDQDVENKIRRLLANDQESQIVVPFTYDEVVNISNPHFMRNRFKDHFYTRDLFAFEAPLKTDLYFFGRNELVHSIVNRHKSNENSGLFGLRKTGKTSVIFGVERALEKNGEKSVIIDCQYPAFHKRRWNRALYYIIQEVKKQLELKLRTKIEEEFSEEDAPIIFEEEIVKIHSSIGGKNILLIFDEIENITFNISPSKHWESDLDFVYFWQTMRSLFQKMNKVFSYLIVGTNPMCIEVPTIHGKDNPIFNQIPFTYIPRFDVPQTKEMVNRLGGIMGFSFDEIIYGKLTEDFGGHPFLIRHVCSVINKISPSDRPIKVTKAIYEEAKTVFNRDYTNYVEMILDVLNRFYRDEYEMLELLACGDIKTFSELAQLGSAFTNHLIGYGIIEQHFNKYNFRIEAVSDYLKRKSKYKKVGLTPEEMYREISHRRNSIEPRLRKIIRTQLQVHSGKFKAKENVLSTLGDPRKSKYASHSYEDLFNPNITKIYFDDLRKLVSKNWECFKNIFPEEKTEIDAKLKAINKYRVDAHAKNLDDVGMQYFRVCISMIEKYLDDFSV